MSPGSSEQRLREDRIHDFGARGKDWPQFLPVDQLRSPGRAVPGQPGYSSIVTPLALSTDTKLCPSSRGAQPPAETGFLGDVAELSAHVVTVKWSADRRGEHKPVVVPCRPSAGPGSVVPPARSRDRHGRNLVQRRRCAGTDDAQAVWADRRISARLRNEPTEWHAAANYRRYARREIMKAMRIRHRG
jgi:hypothetical protein